MQSYKSILAGKHPPERIVFYNAMMKQRGSGMQADEKVTDCAGGFMYLFDQFRQGLVFADERR